VKVVRWVVAIYGGRNFKFVEKIRFKTGVKAYGSERNGESSEPRGVNDNICHYMYNARGRTACFDLVDTHPDDSWNE